MNTNLFINRYKDPNPVRQKELDLCYDINKGCYVVDNIYVVKEGERATFKDLFDKVNEVSCDGDINIIANCDIYIKNLDLSKSNLKHDEAWALGRWEQLKSGAEIPFGRNDSMDTFMFKGKIKDVPDCDFEIGRQGCDNAICERLLRAGYKVLNPSVSVRTYHLHHSCIRNYKPNTIVPKPYLLIEPHQINENPVYIFKP